ncbi:MAG: energy transducer TonB [Parvibaculaceae bacterium]|nr:energy transducer TonB [Parvibaculaceae bacterium]
MAAFRFSMGWLFPVLVAVLLLASPVMLAAQTSSPEEQAVYDIPAQSLESALNAYITASGAQVFYETALTAGRQSGEVKGRFTPAAALRALLAGTELAARRTDVDAFVIMQAPADETGSPAILPDSRFLGALQTGILGALCRDVQTRPGTYKIALELWISPTGVVRRSALIGSTGNATRDAAFTAALQGLVIGALPPADLPQPVFMAIAPRSPQETGDCNGQ